MAKQLEAQVNYILRQIDTRGLDRRERDGLAKLRQALADVRIYVHDYELSEVRDEQLKNAEMAKKYLEQNRQHILKLSEYNIFSAIDVAHLSAQIEQIIGDLK